jgi:septin family protein
LVFITINLYSFILYIQNNFFKTNLEKIITKGFIDGINSSAFDSSIHRRIYRRIYSVGILNTHRQHCRRT